MASFATFNIPLTIANSRLNIAFSDFNLLISEFNFLTLGMLLSIAFK